MQIYYDDDDRDDCYFKEGGDAAAPASMKDKYADETANFKMESAGIQRDRCCTDILCLGLFWAFIGAMVYATIYGYTHGQVNKLTAPIDGDHHFCGFDDYKDYPKMMLTSFDPSKTTEILISGICLKKCPTEKDITLVEGENCKGNANFACDKHTTYETKDVFDFCLPTGKEALKEDEAKAYDYLIKQLKESTAGSVFQDMYKSSTSMYIAMGLSLVWSVAFIYLMSWFAEQLAWCCVFLVWVGLAAGTAFGFMMWQDSSKKVDALKVELKYDAMSEADKEYFDKNQGSEPMQMMLLMGFMGVACLCFTCAVVCGRESLQRAIDVIDASADYIAHNKRVILVPNFHFILTLVFSIVWLGAFLCVVSLNEIKPDKMIPQSRDLEWKDKKVYYAALFMFFGFLWITAWIEYTSRFIVIVGAATYYFNNHRDNQDEEASAEIGYGFKCAYFHHMGSIAFGSFIIALIRFIKIVFYYLAKQLEKSSGDNPAVKAGVKCALCLLNCIEKICDYLNESAFCYMAVTGDHFLSSAWSGFLLNLKHGLKFMFANAIAKIFIAIGKLGIVVGNLFTLYLLMKYRKDYDEVNSVLGPMVVVGVITFLAASLFLSLFDTAVQALLTCLCVDLDANNGEPVYGPATFHDGYVKKTNIEDEANQME